MTPSHPLHPAALPLAQLLADCRVERLRRSGPGGQHRNKVETAVRIRHVPTGIAGEASERRSQEENRRMAVARLRVNLALQCRTTLPETTTGHTASAPASSAPAAAPAPALFEPSPLWRQRCRAGRIAVSAQHDDFPSLLAEALDAIAACADDLPTAASRLGVTPSQLVKLLAKEPRALSAVNAARAARGQRALR